MFLAERSLRFNRDMPKSIVFHPATRYTTQELAAFFTAVYEGYAFPVLITAEQMAKRYREEAIDPGLSAVMEMSGQAAGVFLLGRRGNTCWCGGFGLNKDRRGQGLALRLADEMVAKARLSGATRLQLEVLKNNTVAKRVYERAGMRVSRELLILQWSAPAEAQRSPSDQLQLLPVEKHLARLRLEDSPKPCWQRELPSLLARSGLDALQTRDGKASALIFRLPEGSLRLLSLWCEDQTSAAALLAALQQAAKRIAVVNEPEDSPLLPLLHAAGFAENDRQYEMSMTLDETSARH